MRPAVVSCGLITGKVIEGLGAILCVLDWKVCEVEGGRVPVMWVARLLFSQPQT